MKQRLKILAILGILGMLAWGGCQSSGSRSAAYQDGVYTGSGAGMNGTIPVTVTVKDGRITAVELGAHAETPGVADEALRLIPQAIVEKQSADVDVVAGASMSSRGIMEAVRNALAPRTGTAAAGAMPFEKPDVIVVGAGLAGLTAGIKAAELGANVLIFEQSIRVGGNGNVAGGTLVGVNTIIEAQAGIEDSVDLLIEDFVKLGGRENFDVSLARTYGETSGRVIDWLDKTLGVNFGERKPGYGAYQEMNRTRVHLLTPSDGNDSAAMARGAEGLVKTLSANLDRYIAQGKAHLLLETRVTELIIENRVIVGVVVQDKSGGISRYRAPSTIIATGGYGYNEAWLKEFNFTNIATTVPATATGSGYDFARTAGAAFRGMDFCTTYAGAIPVAGFNVTLSADTSTFRDPIWVDKNGRRFANEAAADTKVKSDAWTNAPDNVVYVLFSAKARTERNSPIGRVANGWDRLEELAAEGKYVFKANTIADLARLAGINQANLTATVNRYNQDVKAGRDSQFGRTTVLTPLEEGPFYAIYTIPFIMITSGGPRMNPQTQMLREDGSVIQGAYICGEIVGMGNVAGHTTIGGIGNGNATVWGVIAAENAVANARR